MINQSNMYLRGFRNLCFFYMCWLGGSFIIPFAMIMALFRVTYIPTYIVVLYYSFRFFFKADRWTYMREALCTDDTPYCNSAKYVKIFTTFTTNPWHVPLLLLLLLVTSMSIYSPLLLLHVPQSQVCQYILTPIFAFNTLIFISNCIIFDWFAQDCLREGRCSPETEQ